jgi:hypothetical protein
MKASVFATTGKQDAPALRVPDRPAHNDNGRMPAALRQRLDEATSLSELDLGSGVIGVSPVKENRQAFAMRRLPELSRALFRGMARAAVEAARAPSKLLYSDADLSHLLNHTCFGRRIKETPQGPVIDLSHYEALPTLPGFYNHGIVARLQRRHGVYELTQIDLCGQTITPRHRSWDFAKIHLLASMDTEVLFADHSVVHVHNNYLEAAVQRTLPQRHPLTLFLRPHFDVAIPLNEWIFGLFYKESPLAKPFGHPPSSIVKVVKKGIEDDHARGLTRQHPATHYNRACAQAMDVVRSHVSAFVANNLPESARDYQHVRAFGDFLHERIPYIPEGAQLTPDILIEVLARFIHDIAFMSAADHISNRDAVGYFGSWFRVRQPFSTTTSCKPGELCHAVDTFQRVLFREVFSGDHCTSRLDRIEYDPSLHIDVQPFRRDLSRLEQMYPQYFPLDRIAATIEV